MNENFVNETPAPTNECDLEEASPRHDSIQKEVDNISQNIQHGYENIVLDENSFNRWMSEMELQSRGTLEAEAGKRQQKLFLSLPYPEFRKSCQKTFLIIATSGFKTRMKLVKKRHSYVNVISGSLKFVPSRREYCSGNKSQNKKASARPKHSKFQKRCTKKKKLW